MSAPPAAVRLSEVAAAAGVSIATVSRALHGSPLVSVETAARVVAAADELGQRRGQRRARDVRRHLRRDLRREVRRHGQRHRGRGREVRRHRRRDVGRQPGRLGTVDDLTGAVLFLASRQAAFVTGQVLLVDGGRTLV